MLSLVPLLLLLPPQADQLPDQLKKLIDVYAVVERQAADPVNPDQAIYGGAIPGMLKKLDPHSIFFDSQQFQQLKDMENSTRKGFGSIVSVLPGRVFVLQALAGTPAAKSGLAPGDEILAVNGIAFNRLDMDQIVQVLSQARQQQARVDVRRPGQERLFQAVLTPEELQAPSVDRAYMLRPGIGYVRATSFDADTGAQIKNAIERLGGSKLKGLVLDLRDNPGGLLPAALETASLFLKPGQTLLSVRGRSVKAQEEKVPGTAAPYTFPMAVLIDGKSASASEIVTGALQDHDRAVVVGAPSFGKGLVQSVYPLSEGTGLALTTAYYYTPSGRSIQKPLAGTQIAPGSANDRTPQPEAFHTDSGRTVRGGGGIQPDFVAWPEQLTPFRIALDANGLFTSFAAEYLRQHPGVTPAFEVTPALLDEFRVYLSGLSVQPSLAEWASERAWVSNRLKTEIFNQALGVERGDEVAAERDPVIQTALAKIAN
jgi:carboxyl-terminal processing protease